MSGSVLRRLIPATRPKTRQDDTDLTVPFDQDESHSRKKSVKKKSPSQSWISTGKKQSIPAATFDLQMLRSGQQDDEPVFQLPIQPSSSVCSLMPSHEAQKEAFPMTPPLTANAASTLCLPEQEESPEHSSLLDKFPRPSLKLDIPGPSLSFSVLDFNPPTRSGDPPDKESPVGPLDTVELVAKGDEAAKEIGTSLKDVRPTTPCLEEVQNATPPLASLPSPEQFNQTDSMPLPLRYSKMQRTRDGMSPGPGTPARKASVKNPIPKKNLQRGSIRGALTRGSQMRGPRSWALSENVTGILTGQRFKRMEADEMLTPERLEELRKSREQARTEEETRAKSRESSDSSHSSHSILSEDPDTPLEPFHLDDLPSRIEEAAIERGTFLDDPSPCTPIGPEDVHQVFEFEQDENLRIQPLAYKPKGKDEYEDEYEYEAEYEYEDDEEDEIDIISGMLLSPFRNPARFETLPLGKPLPEVPVVTLTTPDGSQSPMKRRNHGLPDLTAKEKNGTVYLYSTPFTLNNPMFEHGPITFVKADMSRSLQKMEDTLDWTAFQMAILCGAGELSPDLSWEEDEKQVDDIADWFDSFGFETRGELVGENVSILSSRESSTSMASSSPSTVDTEIDLPIPVGSERPSAFWSSSSQKPSAGKENPFNNSPLNLHDRDMSHDSIASLPPSPMLPLVIFPGDIDEVVSNPIPMGYNLHHDLGDFLKWEAENVYAGGF